MSLRLAGNLSTRVKPALAPLTIRIGIFVIEKRERAVPFSAHEPRDCVIVRLGTQGLHSEPYRIGDLST